MEFTNVEVGQIFTIEDKHPSTPNSMHNYLVISVPNEYKQLGLINCFSITSLRNKEVGMEVPVKLTNDMVSYIVPYNIHSFHPMDIKLKHYKGVITDTPIINKTEFINLLMMIYLDSLDINAIKHEYVTKAYLDYCDNFWSLYPNAIEFRNEHQSIAEDHNKVKTETTVPELIDVDITMEDLKEIRKIGDKRIVNFSKVPSELLILYYKGYKKFGFKGISQVYPRIDTGPKASNFNTKIRSELINRGLLKIDLMELVCSQWTDYQLKEFLSITENHKEDKQFLLGYTGYDTIHKVNTRICQAKREMNRRSLTISN